MNTKQPSCPFPAQPTGEFVTDQGERKRLTQRPRRACGPRSEKQPEVTPSHKVAALISFTFLRPARVSRCIPVIWPTRVIAGHQTGNGSRRSCGTPFLCPGKSGPFATVNDRPTAPLPRGSPASAWSPSVGNPCPPSGDGLPTPVLAHRPRLHSCRGGDRIPGRVVSAVGAAHRRDRHAPVPLRQPIHDGNGTVARHSRRGGQHS